MKLIKKNVGKIPSGTTCKRGERVELTTEVLTTMTADDSFSETASIDNFKTTDNYLTTTRRTTTRTTTTERQRDREDKHDIFTTIFQIIFVYNHCS